MINAERARELSRVGLVQAIKEEIENTLSKIEKACDGGRWYIYLEGWLSTETQDTLKALGYTVKDVNVGPVPSYTKISWQLEEEDHESK